MSRIQKIAWVFVVSTSAALIVSLATVGILYYYAGMPKALAGFSFVGIAGLGGLAPLLIRKDAGPVAVDERDQLFHRRAAIAGFATPYMVFGLGSMIPFFALGPNGVIAVMWLPMIFLGAGISHFFTYSVTILSQYGWTRGERS